MSKPLGVAASHVCHARFGPGRGDWLTDTVRSALSGLLLRAPPATPRGCAGRGTSVRRRLDSCAADPFAGLVAATALATGRAAELHVRNRARPALRERTDLVVSEVSLVRQSTQRPRSLHHTAKRTIARGSPRAPEQVPSKYGRTARASRAARFLVPRSAPSTSAPMSRADRRSSSHQNRSRYHHQRRPSRVVTRTGSSSVTSLDARNVARSSRGDAGQ